MSYENGRFNNSNSGNKEEYRPVYYSPVRMKNETSTIDPSELSFQYWKNMLGISISPKLENSGTSYTAYDHKNSGKVYLTYTRARILHDEMIKLRENPDTYTSVGVRSGVNGLISVANGKEVGVAGFVVIIRKVDQDDGSVNSSYIYEFNREAHFAINNFDETTSKFDKNFYPDIEFDEFLTVLENFYTQAPGYTVAATIDEARKNHNTIYNNLTALMAKMDVPVVSNGGSRRSNGGKSFFDMSQQGGQLADQAAAGVPSRAESMSLSDLESEV